MSEVISFFQNSVFPNLLSSGLWALGGVFGTLLVSYFRKRGHNAFWFTLGLKSEIGIMLSIRPGPEKTNSMRTSISEAIALADFIPILKKQKVDYEVITKYSDDLLTHHENILSLGGPTSNQLTNAILSKYQNVIPVKVITSDEFKGFEVGYKRYSATHSADDMLVTTDYALIAVIHGRVTNDSSKIKVGNRMVIIGCHGYATRYGISFLQSKALLKRFKKYSRITKSFWALVRFDLHQTGDYDFIIEHFQPIEIEELS